MSGDDELKRRMAAAAAVQIGEVIRAAREVGEAVEQTTGYRVVSPGRPSIMDARRPDLEHLLAQVRLTGSRSDAPPPRARQALQRP